MKALIFGANGQDGYYLSKACRQRAIEPIGISRSGNWLKGDISSYEQVEQLIRNHLPDFVFHLAANSSTNHHALWENHQTICTGTINLLEAVRLHCPNTKVFITGSGLQFENNGSPISEETRFNASSAYALSRIQSTYAARYFRSLGLQVYVGYLFHHESPLRKTHHVSKKITTAVQQIAEGKLNVLEIGSIKVKKEWTFAGDVVEGILTLVQQNEIYEAVIGSGVPYSIKDWIELCFRHVGLDWQKYVICQQGFVAEYPCLLSDPKTICALNWKPLVDLPTLATLMMSNHEEL